ncbi:hypothetical protein AB0I02_16810 [Streptomyces phaeochromogenes]
MLTHVVLPGHRIATRQCHRCDGEVPAGYNQAHLRTWKNSLVPCGGGHDDFPDPRGLKVDHAPGCAFTDLPPVVLALCSEIDCEELLTTLRLATGACEESDT